MDGLERLHASLDQFFNGMALSDLPLGERVAEYFCDTVIGDGALRHLPADEVESFKSLMDYHLGMGIDDFDEELMREAFASRGHFILQQFVSSIFELKGRLRERLQATAH